MRIIKLLDIIVIPKTNSHMYCAVNICTVINFMEANFVIGLIFFSIYILWLIDSFIYVFLGGLKSLC